MGRPKKTEARTSITALLTLLVEVTRGARDERVTTVLLNSQQGMVSLVAAERGIIPMALNTAKRVAKEVLPGGFGQLERTRKAALNSLRKVDEVRGPRSRRESLEKTVQELKSTVALLEEDLQHVGDAFEFALRCARRYAAKSEDPRTRARFKNDEVEMLARASLVRKRLFLVSTKSGDAKATA